MNLTERQLVYAGNNAHTMSQMPVQIVLENYTLLYNKRLFVGLDILANTLENSLKFYQKKRSPSWRSEAWAASCMPTSTADRRFTVTRR